MTDVLWQAFRIKDPFTAIMPGEQQETISDWMSNIAYAVTAISQICERHFGKNDVLWAERFGDDLVVEILVVVSSPESLSGTYNVKMDRVLRVKAAPIEDPRLRDPQL